MYAYDEENCLRETITGGRLDRAIWGPKIPGGGSKVEFSLYHKADPVLGAGTIVFFEQVRLIFTATE